jgi:hypothetical protein
MRSSVVLISVYEHFTFSTYYICCDRSFDWRSTRYCSIDLSIVPWLAAIYFKGRLLVMSTLILLALSNHPVGLVLRLLAMLIWFIKLLREVLLVNLFHGALIIELCRSLVHCAWLSDMRRLSGTFLNIVRTLIHASTPVISCLGFCSTYRI